MAGAIGARPRLVWMMTPVPLMTRRSEDEVDCAASARIPAVAALSSQATRSRRRDWRWDATAPFKRARPNSAMRGAMAALLRIRSTDGRPRRAELAVAGAPLGIRRILAAAR